ncbi:MAG TPA: c-type cytochrome [Bryobacteraceae bacterium]|jgi:mono/diheme cytochrome c family protein|nr:c-type cytochrome [Bryobacteraceae bacterium]
MASKPEPPLIGAVKKAVGGRHKQPGRLAFVSWATIRRIYDIVHIMVLRGVAAVLAATVSLTLRNWAIVRVNGDISAFLITVAFAATLSQSAFAADSGALLARGEYLVNVVAACGNCHTKQAPDLLPIPSMHLAGGRRFDIPPGIAYSKNLTPDRDTGIASWSDEQVIRAIREGVTKEGNLIGPPMPIALYNKIADDDVKAMVAYLRSVPPVRNEIPESKYKIKLHAEPTAKDVKAPPKTDKIAYGEYLVNVAHCLECHTPFAANGEPDYAKRAGAGGREFFPIERRPVRARNISSDPETGIGSWTDAQIKKAITEGINKDGKKLIPPMPYGYFKNLAGDDLDAVVAFIRTLPPQKNRVEPNRSLDEYLE